MKNKLFIFICLFCLSFAIAEASPINQKILEKQHTLPPDIKGFKYWYGDVEYGKIIYLGSEDTSGFETELHLEFLNKKISKFLLILGPAGINNYDCLQKYKNIVHTLNKKYGHFKYVRETKDPIIEDLMYSSICTPIKNEIYTISHFWKIKQKKIISTILGDEEGFYIEIEYFIFSNSRDKKPKNLFKIL